MSDKNIINKSKDDKPNANVTDIKTKEVSFVDAAANEEEFLIFKRKDDGKEMKDNCSDGFLYKNDSVVNDNAQTKLFSVDVVKGSIESLTGTAENIMSIISILENTPTSTENGEEVLKSLDMDVVSSLIEIVKDVSGVIANNGKLSFVLEAIAKKGKKISSNRLKKLEEAIILLQSIIEGVNGNQEINKGIGIMVEKTDETEKVKKNVDEKVDGIEETNDETTQTEEDIKKNDTKTDETNESLKKISDTLDKVVGVAEALTKRMDSIESSSNTPSSNNETDETTQTEEDIKKNKSTSIFKNLIKC